MDCAGTDWQQANGIDGGDEEVRASQMTALANERMRRPAILLSHEEQVVEPVLGCSGCAAVGYCRRSLDPEQLTSGCTSNVS